MKLVQKLTLAFVSAACAFLAFNGAARLRREVALFEAHAIREHRSVGRALRSSVLTAARTEGEKHALELIDDATHTHGRIRFGNDVRAWLEGEVICKREHGRPTMPIRDNGPGIPVVNHTPYADLRSVPHNQGGRRGHRPGSVRRSRHRPRSRKLRAKAISVPMIVMTGFGDEDAAHVIRELDAVSFDRPVFARRSARDRTLSPAAERCRFAPMRPSRHSGSEDGRHSATRHFALTGSARRGSCRRSPRE